MYISKIARRSALLILVFVICLMSIVGCSGKKTSSPSELVSYIYETNDFENMSSLTGDKLSAYFNFSDADVQRFSVMISTSDEVIDVIAAFEYRNEDERDKVINGITGYLTKTSNSLKSSLEQQYLKVQNRLLMELDDIIILVISSNSSNIEKQLTELGAVTVA